MNINNYMPTKVITGKGCVKSSAKELAKLGKKCLIVSGKHAAKSSGALADVIDALAGNEQEWKLFDEIEQNPKLSDCMRAAEIASDFRADVIIGIGGGSALDAAKCIAVLAANPGMTQQQLYSFDWANEPLKIAAVGTTAGTGSEVTKVSVITTSDGRKKSFHHEAIFPALSLGDPTYTMTLSDKVTRSTAIDVLAHCTESYFSRSANQISQLYAAVGMRLLIPMLRKIAENGTEELTYDDREMLYIASIYGGLAINVTGTAFPHTMGYLLTEKYGIPHGTACAVFHDAFYEYNKSVVPELTAKFLSEIGCDEQEYLSLIESVLPEYDVAMSENMIDEAHPRWIGNSSIAKCQGLFTPEMADDVLRNKFLK